MSGCYYVCSPHSGDVLDLGKFYTINEQGHVVPVTMGGLLAGRDGKRIEGDALGRVIMQFLMRNRNGDVWVLTESDMMRLQMLDGDRCHFIDNAEAYIKAPVDPLPSGFTEQLTPFGVRRLLEAFHAKEPTFGDSGEKLV